MAPKNTSKKYFMLTFFLVTGIAGTSLARTILEEHVSRYFDQGRTSHYVRAKINDRIFIERTDITQNGTMTEWSIDGKRVDREAFESAQAHALAEEVSTRQKQIAELLQEELLFNQRLQASDASKIIRKGLDFCKKKLAFIDAQGLDKYLAFSPESIASRAVYTQLVQTTLPELEKLLSDITNVTPDQLLTAQKTIITSAYKLHKLANRTIEAAMAQSDDTQMLKKLVELSSGPSEDIQALKELLQAAPA
jgi:hypothetical protein